MYVCVVDVKILNPFQGFHFIINDDVPIIWEMILPLAEHNVIFSEDSKYPLIANLKHLRSKAAQSEEDYGGLP